MAPDGSQPCHRKSRVRTGRYSTSHLCGRNRGLFSRSQKMSSSLCPSRERLSEYLVGRIEEQSIEEISEHVAVCVECQAQLQTLDGNSDTLVSQLRTPDSADPFTSEPECQEVVALV